MWRISGEFGRAIKRMVAVLLPSLEHLCSWFIVERPPRTAAVSATILAAIMPPICRIFICSPPSREGGRPEHLPVATFGQCRSAYVHMRALATLGDSHEGKEGTRVRAIRSSCVARRRDFKYG
jgi:hypothetical protein